ncbi:MAG: hypothetical protein ABMB14_35940 [Myxococcota bacterium]
MILLLTCWATPAHAEDLRDEGGLDYGAPVSDDRADRVVQFRKDVYYVVDAWIVRRVVREDGDKVEEFAVYWDEEPELKGIPDAKLLSQEWAVVDGTGRLLSPAQFGVLAGKLLPDTPHRRGRTELDGVQELFDRDLVESAAAERAAAAAARAQLPPEEVEPLRDEVIASLPPATWSTIPPAPLIDP